MSVFWKYSSNVLMNEFSCMIDMVVGALRPGRTPSAAPATPNAAAFKNCRRESADDAYASSVIATSLSPRPSISRQRHQIFYRSDISPIRAPGLFSILGWRLALATGFCRSEIVRTIAAQQSRRDVRLEPIDVLALQDRLRIAVPRHPDHGAADLLGRGHVIRRDAVEQG